MNRHITASTAPAIGDIRTMGTGDTLWLGADASQRRDWGRYADAVAQAVTRGAEVRRKGIAALTQEQQARADWKEGQR